MTLSFGMIFSIILIIVFIAFSFWAVKKFLGIQEGVKLGQFEDTFQSDIDKIWRGTQGSQSVSYSLPSAIKGTCFVDYSKPYKGNIEQEELYSDLKQAFWEEENLIFYPVGSGDGNDALILKHINLEKITSSENPYCLYTKDGKISATIKMNPGDSLVTVTR